MSSQHPEGKEVLATLHLHVNMLPREAGRHYVRAVEGQEEAAGRDKVFDAERMERALEEAERALWMTRAEYLREMMEKMIAHVDTNNLLIVDKYGNCHRPVQFRVLMITSMSMTLIPTSTTD